MPNKIMYDDDKDIPDIHTHIPRHTLAQHTERVCVGLSICLLEIRHTQKQQEPNDYMNLKTRLRIVALLLASKLQQQQQQQQLTQI